MRPLTLNLTPAQQAVLDGQYRDGWHLHIGSDEGVLSITAHDDSAGTHLQVELKGRDCITAVCGTHLLCDDRFASVRVSATPGAKRALLWVGNSSFSIPFQCAGLVHAWLARAIRPSTAVQPLPACVAEALALAELEHAA
jgi:hypothetical protein